MIRRFNFCCCVTEISEVPGNVGKLNFWKVIFNVKSDGEIAVLHTSKDVAIFIRKDAWKNYMDEMFSTDEVGSTQSFKLSLP